MGNNANKLKNHFKTMLNDAKQDNAKKENKIQFYQTALKRCNIELLKSKKKIVGLNRESLEQKEALKKANHRIEILIRKLNESQKQKKELRARVNKGIAALQS